MSTIITLPDEFEIWTLKNTVVLIFLSTVRTAVHVSCDHEIRLFWGPEVTSLPVVS